MAKKYLDYDGLSHLWLQIKSLFVADVSYDSTNQKITKTKAGSTSDVVTVSTLKSAMSIPAAATATPSMDGTGAVGSSTKYAKEDHVHPSDTSRVPTSRTVNGHALSSNVTVTNVDLGQGYATTPASPSTATWTATLSNYLLTTGGIVSVKFTNDVSANATLNINSQGAKPIYYKGAAITSNVIRQYDIATFMYDGSYYHLITIDRSVDVPVITGDTDEIDINVSGTSYSTWTVEKIRSGLTSKISTSQIGAASGVCPLNSSSKIDSTYLPSYVDDVIEAYARSGQTALSQNWLSTTSGGSALTPETGKIYILMADSGTYSANDQFRWSGSTYVKLADGGVSSITNSEIDTILAS